MYSITASVSPFSSWISGKNSVKWPWVETILSDWCRIGEWVGVFCMRKTSSYCEHSEGLKSLSKNPKVHFQVLVLEAQDPGGDSVFLFLFSCRDFSVFANGDVSCFPAAQWWHQWEAESPHPLSLPVSQSETRRRVDHLKPAWIQDWGSWLAAVCESSLNVWASFSDRVSEKQRNEKNWKEKRKKQVFIISVIWSLREWDFIRFCTLIQTFSPDTFEQFNTLFWRIALFQS